MRTNLFTIIEKMKKKMQKIGITEGVLNLRRSPLDGNALPTAPRHNYNTALNVDYLSKTIKLQCAITSKLMICANFRLHHRFHR